MKISVILSTGSKGPCIAITDSIKISIITIITSFAFGFKLFTKCSLNKFFSSVKSVEITAHGNLQFYNIFCFDENKKWTYIDIFK